MSEKTCVICAAPFEGRSDAQYCSDRCRQQSQRDRSKSDAIAVIGGISAPVLSFTAAVGAFGEIGSASIELAALRGEPQRDSAGRIAVELTVGEVKLWAGDLQSIEHLPGSITLRAAGPFARLAGQTWGPGTWPALSVEQFARGAAQRAGLGYMAPETPLDPMALGTTLDAAGSVSALDLLIYIAREGGLDLQVRGDTLYIGTALPSEPRAIEARDLQVIAYAGETDQIAVIVRSQAPTAHGRTLATGYLSDVPVGRAAYVVTATNLRQGDIDALSERLSRELGAQVIHASARIDFVQQPVIVGDLVAIEQAGDVSLRVSRIEHSFTTSGGLSTRIEALYLPPLTCVRLAQPRAVPPRVTSPAWAVEPQPAPAPRDAAC